MNSPLLNPSPPLIPVQPLSPSPPLNSVRPLNYAPPNPETFNPALGCTPESHCLPASNSAIRSQQHHARSTATLQPGRAYGQCVIGSSGLDLIVPPTSSKNQSRANFGYLLFQQQQNFLLLSNSQTLVRVWWLVLGHVVCSAKIQRQGDQKCEKQIAPGRNN